MTTALMPNPKQQYFLAAGIPLVGGKIYTYAAGTNNPKDTYTDSAGTVPQANPIILNARGEPASAIFWSGAYTVEIHDALDNLIYTVDNYNTDPLGLGTFISDISDTVSVSKGAAMIGRGAQVVSSIAALRNLLKTTPSKNAFVTGYYAAGDGGGGPYWLDILDTTSADNGGTIVIAADGGRWKLQILASVDVRQFGAKGDNVTNDGPVIQKALDACALQRIGLLTFSNGRYITNQELLIRQGAQTTSSDVGSNIHFMHDQNKLLIVSDSHATLKAGAAITSVLKLSPTTVGGLGSYANFYSEIRGLLIDGNNQAGIGISIDSAMHVKIERNAICNVTTGVFNTGYGVHDVVKNVIRATVCISYIGGGDSMFEHNDLFIATGGSGILLKPFAGSTLLHRNTYTPLDTTVADNGTKAIELRADNLGDDVKALGAIKIAHECFDGVRYGVYGRGFSAGIINLKSIDIHDCYIGGAGSSTGQLVDIAFATAINIHDNDVTPGFNEPAMRSLGTLFTVVGAKVHNNSINICTGDGLVLDGACSDVLVENNKMSNVGIGNTTQAHVRVKGNCSGNYIRRNTFIQPFNTGALNGVVEEGAADRTFCDNNEMGNNGSFINVEYVKVGANSRMVSRLSLAAAPATGTWLAGARNERPAPAAGTFMFDICTTGGTPGTWKTAGAITP